MKPRSESKGQPTNPDLGDGTQHSVMDSTQRLSDYFDLDPPTSPTAADDAKDDTEEGIDDDEQLPGAHRISSLSDRVQEDKDDHTIEYGDNDNARGGADNQFDDNTSSTVGISVVELQRRVEELELIRSEENVVEAHAVETNEQQPEVRDGHASINVENVVMVADIVQQQHPASKILVMAASGIAILLVVAIVTVAWVGINSSTSPPALPNDVEPTSIPAKNDTNATIETNDTNATKIKYIKSESIGGKGGVSFDDAKVLPVFDRIEYVTNVTLSTLHGNLERVTLEVITKGGTQLSLGSTLASGSTMGYSGWPTTLSMNQQNDDQFANNTLEEKPNATYSNHTFEEGRVMFKDNATEYEIISSMYVETASIQFIVNDVLTDASVVGYLKLTTNLGRSIEAGTLAESGNGTTFAIDQHQIVGFHGRAGGMVDRLGAIFMANE